MGDENPIRTLRDYSKLSHRGYRNTIELPVGNNVVPLRFETIRLVQNECLFHELWFEDPNQQLKDFLKLVDSLNLDVDFHRCVFLLYPLVKDNLLVLYGVDEDLTNLAKEAPTAQINFMSTNYHTKEELRRKGIKSPSKLLSPVRMKMRKKAVLNPAKLSTQTAKRQIELINKLKAKRKLKKKLKEKPKKKRKMTWNTSTLSLL
nr:zinc finger, CCHC-type [Tanacetum cinerariifolium]